MNLRDALIAGSEHGIDRLSIDADRRLRRRLGLESTRAALPRRTWVWPALGLAAAAALLLVYVRMRPTDEEPAVAMTGFVDSSAQRWDGTLTTDTLDVGATSPASATVTWRDAAITAAPGTKLTARPDGGLVLASGAIRIARSHARSMVVDVPLGRAVFASYRSSITANRDAVTIVLDDGGGQFTDATGHTHALAPATPLVLPLAVRTEPAQDSGAPGIAPPVPPRPAPRRLPPAPSEAPPVPAPSGPPGLTPPRRRPDTPCRYKSDCDPGATCRKNEDGDSVCMGNGGEGAACWFDSDCVSKTCVSRRCAASVDAIDRR